jgi:hypothetical protein
MKHKIKTPNGVGTLEKIYASELGFLMVRVYFPDTKSFITYNVDKLENFLENTQLKLEK